jgi:hypothetical protein
MGPLLVIELESGVSQGAASGVAACEELRQVDGLVLFDLRVSAGMTVSNGAGRGEGQRRVKGLTCT